jgi:hypothetical protein
VSVSSSSRTRRTTTVSPPTPTRRHYSSPNRTSTLPTTTTPTTTTMKVRIHDNDDVDCRIGLISWDSDAAPFLKCNIYASLCSTVVLIYNNR